MLEFHRRLRLHQNFNRPGKGWFEMWWEISQTALPCVIVKITDATTTASNCFEGVLDWNVKGDGGHYDSRMFNSCQQGVVKTFVYREEEPNSAEIEGGTSPGQWAGVTYFGSCIRQGTGFTTSNRMSCMDLFDPGGRNLNVNPCRHAVYPERLR